MVRLISMYDDNVINTVLQLRAKAVSNLPKNLADTKIVEVLQSLYPSVREKIMKNMK